MSKSLTMCPFT